MGDDILDRRTEYLGEVSRTDAQVNFREAVEKLRRYVVDLKAYILKVLNQVPLVQGNVPVSINSREKLCVSICQEVIMNILEDKWYIFPPEGVDEVGPFENEKDAEAASSTLSIHKEDKSVYSTGVGANVMKGSQILADEELVKTYRRIV